MLGSLLIQNTKGVMKTNVQDIISKFAENKAWKQRNSKNCDIIHVDIEKVGETGRHKAD